MNREIAYKMILFLRRFYFDENEWKTIADFIDSLVVEDDEDKITSLRDRAWSVWTDIKDMVNENHDDKIFFSHPIKTPTLEITDNLKEIGDWLDQQSS